MSPPSPSDESPGTTDGREDPFAATRILWRSLARPLSSHDAARAVVGLDGDAVARLSGRSVANSAEALNLLTAMPEILRNLSITTEATAERCQGEIRGPVLWSETMSARSGTAGATDVFMCLTSRRAYDTPQNRVLVAALTAIRRAAVQADPAGGVADATDDEVLAARAHGDVARRFLEHRTLRDVGRKRPSRRDLAKASTGRRHRRYAPALALLARARDPIDLDQLVHFVDRHTARQHEVIVALATQLRRIGLSFGAFRVTPNGELRAEAFMYRHPNVAASMHNPLHGIFLDGVLVDVPEDAAATDTSAAADMLAARAQGRTPVLVTSQADVERAVELARDHLG